MATAVAPIPDLRSQTGDVRAAVEEVAPPPGIRLVEVLLDTDRTGDPAIYLVYRVTRRVPLTRKRVSALTDFREVVMAAVDQLHTGRFPYVRFVE